MNINVVSKDFGYPYQLFAVALLLGDGLHLEES